jgi:hypothetical protein
MDTENELFTPEAIEGLERLSELRETHPLTYAIELKRALKDAGEDPGKDFVYKTVQALREERASSSKDSAPEEISLGDTLEEQEEPMTDVWDELAKIRGEYEQRVEAIRQDPTLSDVGRGQRLAEVYQDHALRHKELTEGAREARQRRFDDANKRLFSPRLPAALSEGEQETMIMSYRDATSRVEAALDKAASRHEGDPIENKSAALKRLLDQAESSGDERLATAVFHKAALEDLGDVTEAYTSNRPQQRRALEAARAAKQGLEELNSANGLLARAYSSIPKPPELSGQYFPEVEGAAEIVVNPQKESAARLRRRLTGGAA